MKKLLVTLFTIIIHPIVSGQQWLHFLPSASADWINIHDLDVAGNSLTLEALVSVQDTNQLNGLNILSKHTAPADVNYILRPNRFEITTTNGYVLAENPISLCLDSVYHLAGTYDGDSVRFYVNAQVVASIAHNGTLVNNNFNAAIGNRANPTDEQFKGFIDEVRIWNVARTQSELSANKYNISNPTAEPGLIAYYKFEGDFMNAQGNQSWNGGVIGSQSSLSPNPYYSGSIANGFCSTIMGISAIQKPFIIRIAPNPNDGDFTISIPGTFANKTFLKITNSIGQCIFGSEIDPSVSIKLNVRNGIYFAYLTDEMHSYIGKIIIQR